jgi:hypothetical protein
MGPELDALGQLGPLIDGADQWIVRPMALPQPCR